MLDFTLRRMVTPPPVAAATPPAISATSLASHALMESLYLTVPSSGASNSVANTRMRCVSCHPSLPLVAYSLESSDLSKLSPQRQLVVQHTTTRQVLWKCSMGDLASLLFEFDTQASNGPSKQAAALRSMGQVQRLDFFDPSTLHASGMIDSQSSIPESGRWQYLVVQLHQRVAVLNLRTGPNSHSLQSERRTQRHPSRDPFRPVLAQVVEASLRAAPTTSVLPLTPTLLLVGCADGTIRCYDWKHEKLIKSARGPSGKDDAILYLLATNPYNSHPSENEGGEATGIADKIVKRVISIGKKGVAYLWEIVLQYGTLIDIRPPLARLEGHFASVAAASPGDSSAGPGAGVNVVKKEAESTPDTGLFDHVLVDYDAHRDWFLWFVPHGYKGSTKPHVLLWDLSKMEDNRHKKTVVPKQDPVVMIISHLDAPVTLVAGWFHPAFPDTACTCAVATQSGELHVVAVSMAEALLGRIVKATPFFTTNLSSMIQRDAGSISAPKIRVQSLTTPRRIDTTTLVVGTDLGLVLVGLDDVINGGGTRHAHLGARFAEYGKSVLMVDHSAIIWAQLHVPEANPKGMILVKSPTLVYRSPPPLHLSVDIQKRTVRLPPRFLPSPSGNFLCLYWQHELRYEILHVASILRRSDGAYSLAVASGTNVLSFAWVGETDVFALIYPPAEIRGEAISSPTDSTRTPTTTLSRESSALALSKKGALGLRKSFNFVNDKVRKGQAPNLLSSPTLTKEDYVNDGSRYLPRVELKVLVGVTANAAEISGSIAAATATILGDITLRGGNRSPPTTLFGGPVLCVASKGLKESDGGTAYFYTRKPGNDENRASAYQAAGPTLPYPDFLEWDDDGRLCAVVVQSRVAIYLSEAPQFILLGNVQLGCPSEPDVTVTGMKFIHGVLYCTTKTSVQCIFLGDLEDGICHLDSFILASASCPDMSRQSYSLTPPTVPMTLNHPCVLGYQSGSLLLSTASGLQAIPLNHPLLRIGSLLAAGQPSRAQRWFDMVPESDHERLAAFLERRGAPDMAVQLSGLSLESMVDMCLRYGLTQRLEEIVDAYGLDSIRRIDLGRGVSTGMFGTEEHGHSIVVCVGAYLLSQGKAELVRRLATECLRSGEEGKKEAFVLASLLLAVDVSDARRLVKRAVSASTKNPDHDEDDMHPTANVDDYNPVRAMIRDFIL